MLEVRRSSWTYLRQLFLLKQNMVYMKATQAARSNSSFSFFHWGWALHFLLYLPGFGHWWAEFIVIVDETPSGPEGGRMWTAARPMSSHHQALADEPKYVRSLLRFTGISHAWALTHADARLHKSSGQPRNLYYRIEFQIAIHYHFYIKIRSKTYCLKSFFFFF